MSTTANQKKVLIINSGSTSLKFSLYEVNSKNLLVSGNIQAINSPNAELELSQKVGKQKISLPNYTFSKCIAKIMPLLKELNYINNLSEIHAVAHRIVSGGEFFKESTILNANNYQQLLKCSDLAPLHNPVNILCYEEFLKILPDAKHIGIFDTSFHTSLAPEEFLYPIPYSFYENYNIRRYGFHGTSYRYIKDAYEKITKKKQYNIIVCHIGGGVSLCAIKDGKSVATSMGLTPLAGPIMSTRSGDMDPGVVLMMAKFAKLSFPEVEKILNFQSGLKGISGLPTGDIRSIIEAKTKGSKQAQYAWDMFINRLIDHIAKYYFLFNGEVSAIILTAGISENSIEFRQELLPRLAKTLGVKLNDNINIRGTNLLLSEAAKNKPEIRIIPTNEEMVMFNDACEFIK